MLIFKVIEVGLLAVKVIKRAIKRKVNEMMFTCVIIAVSEKKVTHIGSRKYSNPFITENFRTIHVT